MKTQIQKYVKGIGRRASIVFAVGVIAFVMTELYRSIYNLTDSTAWAIAGISLSRTRKIKIEKGMEREERSDMEYTVGVINRALLVILFFIGYGVSWDVFNYILKGTENEWLAGGVTFLLTSAITIFVYFPRKSERE